MCKSLEVLHSQAAGVLLRHSSISLCTRRNQSGQFVKLQTTKPPAFIFVPFGRGCNGLVGLAELLAQALELASVSGYFARPTDRFLADSEDRIPVKWNSKANSSATPPASFAEVIRRRCLQESDVSGQNSAMAAHIADEQATGSSATTSRKDPSMATLFDKILALELEISFLHAHLRLESSFMEALLSIYTKEELKVAQPSAVENSSAVALSPNLSEKMNANPAVHVYLDPMAEINLDKSMGKWADSFFIDIDSVNAPVLVDGIRFYYPEHIGCHSACFEATANDSKESADDPFYTSPLAVSGEIGETVSALPNHIFLQHDEATKIQNCESSADNVANVCSNNEQPTLRFQELNNEHEFDEYLGTIESPHKAFLWNDNIYMHVASGMQYDQVDNVFFNWVTQDGNDERALFYTPVEGTFKHIQDGKYGEANRQLLTGIEIAYSQRSPKVIIWISSPSLKKR